ncbi:MAG TPA: FHA domain-containing protein [Kofleriaceae bacterium]
MACSCCGAAPEVGALCRRCAREVAPCEGLIPDHVRSTVDAAAAVAWLIDGFGGAHAVGARCRIGRSHDGDLVVLASSVSREHAELIRGDAGWTVRDLGSRNGTLLDGARCQGHTALPPRAIVKVGDVALWFLAEVHEPPRAPVMATGGAGAGVVRYQLAHGGAELCLVGGSDPSAGGALLSRPAGTESWTERGLPPLEFQLLRALCVRALGEAAAPSIVRGCVPTKQLARELPFQSRFANEENVRQVVRRLRGVLTEAGATGAVAVAPGRGYYLACRVAVG